MKITNEIWKELLTLHRTYENKGDTLTRRIVKAHFDLSEHQARFLYDALDSRDVLGTEPLSTKTNLTEKNKQLKKELREHVNEILSLNKRLEVYDELSVKQVAPPTWTSPRKAGRSKVIAHAMLSDIHYAETVDPAQIEWMNSYDLQIADKRLETFFDKVCMLGDGIYADMHVEGLVLAIAGDCLSGNIHQELESTNGAPVIEACFLLAERICTGIEQLKERYGRVFCPCVVGNHGRNYHGKIKAKDYVKDNYDYLLYQLLGKYFANDDQVTFQIAESTDTTYKIYDTTIRLTHGASFRGGAGISGPIMPIKRGDYKLRSRSAAVGNDYEILCLGHFHTYQTHPDIIMNGSIVGVNEYSYQGLFSFQPPMQSFCLIDKAHGKIADFPIYCAHEDEDWHLEKPEHIF